MSLNFQGDTNDFLEPMHHFMIYLVGPYWRSTAVLPPQGKFHPSVKISSSFFAKCIAFAVLVMSSHRINKYVSFLKKKGFGTFLLTIFFLQNCQLQQSYMLETQSPWHARKVKFLEFKIPQHFTFARPRLFSKMLQLRVRISKKISSTLPTSQRLLMRLTDTINILLISWSFQINFLN